MAFGLGYRQHYTGRKYIKFRKRPWFFGSKVESKVSKLVLKGCLLVGVILALKSFFSVPKIVNNYHMLFDATLSILNESVWYTNFNIPYFRSL